MTDNITG